MVAGRGTPGSAGAAGSGLKAPQAGGNPSPMARVTPGNGTRLRLNEPQPWGCSRPPKGTGEARRRSMAWPRLHEDLKAAGRAQGSEGAAVATGPLYRTPSEGSTPAWDFTHHKHRKVEIWVPPHPPKTSGPRKRGHTWEAPAQPRPIKAKIKGLQEQLRAFQKPAGAWAGRG